MFPFTNGPTGTHNPNRQGLAAAIQDGASPLNILQHIPPAPTYSPIWDVHLADWSHAATASGQDQRQTSFPAVLTLAKRGLVTGPARARFGPSGFVVNCPAISIDT